MKLKRIISLGMAAVLAISLTSCAKTPESLIEKADKKLERGKYTVEVDIDYTASDKAISGVLEQLEGSDTKLYFDGEDVLVEQRMAIDYGEGDTSFFGNHVIVDGTVYSDSGYTVSGVGNTVKQRASITDGQKKELIEKAGVVIGVGIENFSAATLDKIDGEQIITCTGADEELSIRLENILLSQLEGAAESVGVSNVRMLIEIDDGRYESVKVICDYSIVLSSKTYSVKAEFELEYDYDDYVRVIAPNNASEYGFTDFESILDTI